jgi:hypothetical protein
VEEKVFRMKYRFNFIISQLCLLLITSVTLFAQGILAVDELVPPAHQSDAFRQFTTRPYSELSKILYLIDRFGSTDVEILYDGHYYHARFAKQVARWFLFHHYRKETAEQWIWRWCNKTVVTNNLIWVRFQDGTSRLAREVLLEELGALEKAYFEQYSAKESTFDVKLLNQVQGQLTPAAESES